MFVVDTNVLVFAANGDAREHLPCRELLRAWCVQADPWFLTWNIAYEFLRVSTHSRTMSKPFPIEGAWRFLERVLASPGVQMLEHTHRHGTVVADILSEVPLLKGNILFDLHTAALLREHGIRRIYTRDTDFHRFKFLDVIDPLTASCGP